LAHGLGPFALLPGPLPGVTEQRLDHVLGRPHTAADRVNGPDHRHTLLIGLLAFLAVPADLGLAGGPAHDHALAVGLGHHDRALAPRAPHRPALPPRPDL